MVRGIFFWPRMPPTTVLYVIVLMSTSIASVCGNITLLLAVTLDKRLQTETWALTLSFCLSNLALGLCTIPFVVHNSLSQVQDYAGRSALCQASGFLFVFLQLASVHSLTWATVDKFTEICFALQYPQLFTRRRTHGALALLWSYSLLNAVLPLLGFGSYSYSRTRFICTPSFQPSSKGFSILFLGLGIIIPILIMCSLYTYLVYIARTQALRGTFICNEQHCYCIPAKNYLRSSAVMATNSACLPICWLPYITTCFYEIFTGQESAEWVNAVATWLVLLTSALNPWIHYMTQKKYREALWGSCGRLKQRFQRPPKITFPHWLRNQAPTGGTSPEMLNQPRALLPGTYSSSPQGADHSSHA